MIKLFLMNKFPLINMLTVTVYIVLCDCDASIVKLLFWLMPRGPTVALSISAGVHRESDWWLMITFKINICFSTIFRSTQILITNSESL